VDANDRLALARSVRQRLEDLARAGIDRLNLPLADVTPSDELPPAQLAAPADRVVPSISPIPSPTTRLSPPPQPFAPPMLSSIGSLFDEPEAEDPITDPTERARVLATLAAEVATCSRCPQLAATRTQTVFGTGSPTARLMFIGEAPGAEEDRRGEPFVGRAGALLTDMITKGMGLARSDVYIANVLKSRPPENRTPMPDEVAHCLPYLQRQITIIRPEFLCLLGKSAVAALLDTTLSMTRLRGRWHRYREIPTVVTWHPAYLLRNPAAKREAWEDLQMLMQAMGLKPQGREP
jgi:DNA polymerase